jgi:hypothetical protein
MEKSQGGKLGVQTFSDISTCFQTGNHFTESKTGCVLEKSTAMILN